MAEQKNGKNLTVFGQETEFDGVLQFTDNLIITGKFHGTIISEGNLELEKTSICETDSISAKSIVVSGNVKGNLIATERVELCAGSSIRGDIKTDKLRIADNVDFEGKVDMIDSVPDIDLFSMSSKEYKDSLIQKSQI